MLQRGEERERVVALLEYLSNTDHEMFMSVREKAQAVLATHTQKVTSPSLKANDAKYIFGARCKNGHVTYFDKREVCNKHKNVYRELIGMYSRPEQKTTLYLKCRQCGEEMEVEVECEDYQ
jgi:hypothetical protein